MDEWLKTLKKISIEKKLSTTQSKTLAAKFPMPKGIETDRNLVDTLKIEANTLTRRLNVLYRAFDIAGTLKGKDRVLQDLLQQRRQFDSPQPPHHPRSDN
jgi:hypothetical protein